MKKVYLTTLITALIVIIVSYFMINFICVQKEPNDIKVGFVYVGDASNPYTRNHIKAESTLRNLYGEKVTISSKYNILEGNETIALKELVEENCDLIFMTSYGYGESTKKFAEKYPEVQFCQATCDNANVEPVLPNYHTFMGEIYQGRYISGVMAGLKLKELIDEGKITTDQALVGYVAAYPYVEVISGYTAFVLGVRSVVPEAIMEVIYTNTWSSYSIEFEATKKLIDRGCIIISQHSDTSGPAVACENADTDKPIYHIGYNQSLIDFAPTTTLGGTRINWEPYVVSAVDAIMNEKIIEKSVQANIHGQDAGGGFKEKWVEMLEINEIVAAKGTKEKVDELIEKFIDNKIVVFKGDYIGVNPADENDTIDLKDGYIENENASAPSFCYVLKDVVKIVE